MKRRPMCVAFAALLMVLTATTARDSARASGFEPGAGFILEAGAAALASHFEPKRSDAPASEAQYQPRILPPNHPPIGPPVPAQSRYQPRMPADHPPIAPHREYPRGFGQIHSGVMDPEGQLGPAFVLGGRFGTQINPMVQLGLGVDWRHKSGQATEVIQEGVGPGGEPVTLYRDLNKFTSDLVPGMLYLQISLPASLWIAPYVGAGAGWQVLFLSADDYQSATSFDATYDGFGWQAWAGAGLRLSGHTRLFGEVFYNEADLSRNVYDYALDVNYRETIRTEDVGARGGLSFGF